MNLTKRTSYKVILAAAAVLAAALLAYSNSFQGAFQFDDYNQINENPYIRDLANVPRFFYDASIGSDWTQFAGLTGYRPITYSSFAFNYALGAYAPAGYHVFNFSVHFLNSLLVFFMVDAILRASGREKRFALSLLSALVFAVHPVQTGAVTYISGRAALLASFFYLLAFLCFLSFRRSGGSPAGKAAGAAAPLLYLLALFSKEMAVSLPAAMLAFDLLFTAPARGGLRKSWRMLLYYLPFAGLLVLYVFTKKALQGFVAGPVLAMGTPEYLMSEAKVLLMYARLLLLPFNQNADYNLPAAMAPDLHFFIAAAVICAAFWYFYRLRSRLPEAAFFGAWFFIALAPESSLVPIPDIAVEYRVYLASAGFITAGLVLAPGLMKGGRFMRAATAAVVLFLALAAFNRNFVWQTSVGFWEDAKAKAPWSDRARANLGKALLDEGRHDEAAREFEAFLSGDHGPDAVFIVLNNLGISYSKMGRKEDAVIAFNKAIEIFPDNPEPYLNLSDVYRSMGRPADAEEALRAFARAKASGRGGF